MADFVVQWRALGAGGHSIPADASPRQLNFASLGKVRIVEIARSYRRALSVRSNFRSGCDDGFLTHWHAKMRIHFCAKFLSPK